ncbi:MAG: molybdenum cofactor biosynthesis protein MoaE [Planctomycetes bacterium]|nr:molybdenum cofactor biosynthesis protein MoaE [Planctomycetota bacterium]
MGTTHSNRSHLTRSAIELARLVAQVATVDDGAICTFVGTARRNSEGREVNLLRYEAYPEMADQEIGAIVAEAERKFSGARIATLHRLGDCPLGEASVAVVAAAPHRVEAFAACRYVIDEIKARAPIWKQEQFRDGTAWVGDPGSFKPRIP